MNLPSISEIMRLAAELNITHVLSSDFKHYFFQLGLPKGAEKYFGFPCNDRSGPVNVVRYFFQPCMGHGRFVLTFLGPGPQHDLHFKKAPSAGFHSATDPTNAPCSLNGGCTAG